MSEDTILSALLDYYSDKASASASLVVATIFGLFAVLTLSQEPDHHALMFLVYWSLFGAGLYFLMSFRFWVGHAAWTLFFMMKQPWENATKASEPLDPAELRRFIVRCVRDEWSKTFLRGTFLLLKFRRRVRAHFKEWFCESQKIGDIHLGAVLPTFFLGFGLIISTIFFREWWHNVFYSVPLIILFLDFISTLQHRARWRTLFGLCVSAVFLTMVFIIVKSMLFA